MYRRSSPIVSFSSDVKECSSSFPIKYGSSLLLIVVHPTIDALVIAIMTALFNRANILIPNLEKQTRQLRELNQ